MESSIGIGIGIEIIIIPHRIGRNHIFSLNLKLYTVSLLGRRRARMWVYWRLHYRWDHCDFISIHYLFLLFFPLYF